MKKIVRTLVGGLAVALSFGMLASCGEETKQESTTEVAASVTVTFYDGKTVLKEVAVDSGKTIESYTPAKEGYTFLGWYATPTYTHEFDFTKAITENTSVFACFKSAEFKEDGRTWYILGNGTSTVLKASAWGSKLTDEMKLVKQDIENVNQFDITLNLCAGDEFQFGINSSWEFQRGAGYMDSVTQDGVDYFAGSGGLSADTRKSNIKCLVDGNYTFSLTTNPLEDDRTTQMNDFDKITFKYNGEATEAPVEDPDLESFQLIIKGTMTEWAESERMNSENLCVKFNYTFAVGDEFGFAWFKDATETGYGTYINYTAIGTTGTKNSDFAAADHDNGNDNFKALAQGEYEIVVSITAKRVVTVDFNEVTK